MTVLNVHWWSRITGAEPCPQTESRLMNDALGKEPVLSQARCAIPNRFWGIACRQETKIHLHKSKVECVREILYSFLMEFIFLPLYPFIVLRKSHSKTNWAHGLQ